MNLLRAHERLMVKCMFEHGKAFIMEKSREKPGRK
jgi:hypothetical protein